MPELYALADLHIGHLLNSKALDNLEIRSPGDGLILAGDLGETKAHLETCFRKTKACFDHVFWVPGNHELYSSPSSSATGFDALKGEAKYNACIELARSHGVLTPEDSWMLWRDGDRQTIIALCFTLYDYSFRPADVSREQALDWAREQDIVATDEMLLHSAPYPTRDEWCHSLCDRTEKKFEEYASKHPDASFIIVNHWPLREDLIHIPLIPRFSLWCGTKRTGDWHARGRFGDGHPGALAVITGHLHVRRTDWIDGCRFEEVSLGYPRQWSLARESGRDVNDMLRKILPGPPNPTPNPTSNQRPQTQWRRLG